MTAESITPLATTMAGTDFEHCAGICPTHGFASSAIGGIFASDAAYEQARALDEVRDHLTRCTEAHQRGDMEAFHSAWHAEVCALMALGDGGDFFGAMGERDRSRLEGCI